MTERILEMTHYEVHTPIFDGPLAVLLDLIEKAELDVTQVALAQVTDQFLEHVARMEKNVSLPLVADFLSVAARLVLIKSRVLLPKAPEPEPGTDDDVIEDELVRQLRAYRQYKEAAHWLRERDHAGLHAYVGERPPPRPKHVTLDMSNLTVDALHEAAQRLFYPTDGPRPQEAIQRPRVSIKQQIRLIREKLQHWQQVAFHALLSSETTRVEAVVTLQALLELVKQRAIQVMQSGLFDEILIEALVAPEEIPESFLEAESPPPPPQNQ